MKQAAQEARHSREITCIFRAEVGGYGFDPYVPHTDAGVFGPGGLATYGLLPEFTRWTAARGEDPNRYSPYQVARYIDWVLDEGRGRNWPYLASWLASGRC